MQNSSPKAIWSAALCATTSVAFVALAGCFLAGVLLIVTPIAFPNWEDPFAPRELGDGQRSLLIALCVAAAACFGIALGALGLAVRKLP